MILRIKVNPSAKHQSLVLQDDGTGVASLKSPPVDGRANEELIRLLADTFKVPQRAITIKRGQSGRQKVVEIETE